MVTLRSEIVMLFKRLNNNRYSSVRCFTVICSLLPALLILPGCAGYQNPPGKWVPINASALYFSGVELNDDAITSGYKDTCMEAQYEIEKQLISKLPAQIAPLALYTTENPPAADVKTAELKILITQCDIDSDQGGETFYYYLSLPLHITLTMENRVILDYPMKTYEQIQISDPSPAFEFTFAEAEKRTLLLFKGHQIWIPDGTAR